MLDYLADLLQNRVLLAAVAGWTAAQVLKTILVLIIEKELRLERLMGSGGMPSSHSATTCALATACSVIHGPDSTQFALAFILAFIVMYDACNVRLETGKQAIAIKELQELLQKMGQKLSPEEKLKELVGHTLPQVLVGALLGTLIGLGVTLL